MILTQPEQGLTRVVAWLLDAVVYVLLIFTLPFSPFAASVIARDMRYVRSYRITLIQAWLHIHAMRRAQVISRNLLRSKAELENTLIKGSCTHCGRCCVHNTCVFLEHTDEDQSRCSIYGSRFFDLLSCGEYPLTASDISVYECPSYTAEQHRQFTPQLSFNGSSTRRVIYIRDDEQVQREGTTNALSSKR